MVVGVNAPFGLQPQFLPGSIWNGQTDVAYISPTNVNPIGQYDPVVMLQDGTITALSNAPEAPLLGVFMGCQYRTTESTGILGNLQQRTSFPGGPISTVGNENITAFVIMDQNVRYRVQVSSTTPNFNTVMGVMQQDIGQNGDLSIGGGTGWGGATYPDGTPVVTNPDTYNTISGMSAYYLDRGTMPSSGLGVDSGRHAKVIGLDSEPGNVFCQGSNTADVAAVGAFNRVLITLNQSMFQGNTTTYPGAPVISQKTVVIPLANFLTITSGDPFGLLEQTSDTSGFQFQVYGFSLTIHIPVGGTPLTAPAASGLLLIQGTSVGANNQITNATAIPGTAISGITAGNSLRFEPPIAPGNPFQVSATVMSGGDTSIALASDNAAVYTGGDGAIITCTITYALVPTAGY